MPRWFDLSLHLRTQADAAVGQAYARDCERLGRKAIVATFKRKLPSQLPSRWTEVTHPRALKAAEELIETAEETAS